MSFNARVTYTANGSTDTFSFSFPYILQSHVKAFVNGTEDTNITFPTASSIQLSSTPANGAVVLIKRTTPSNARLVDFQDGSVLTSADLDQSADQNFFLAQETSDNVAGNISLDTSDRFDALNKRIINVADPVDNNDAVNKGFISTNLPNINTVAGIAANITTVAGNLSAINSANSNSTNINTVATNIANVNTVATNIADVQKVAQDLNEAVSEIETVADDLNEASSEIDVVAGSIANVNTVGGDITNINTVATNISNINAVNSNSSNINAVAGNQTNIDAVAGNSTNINAVNSNSSNINTVAGISSNITTVAGMNTAITTVNNNATNINNVAGAITNINSVAGGITNINTVASNLSGVNSFAERYRVQAGVPSSSNDVGDLVFDTTAQKLKVFDGTSYALAGSSVNGTSQRFRYVATAGQTTFSGADANGNTLTYDVASGTAFADIYLNGVKLDTSDFTATNGTSIVLGTGASVNDIFQVVSYGTFSLANQSAANITSGTLSNDRLPSPTLIVKGDGSSVDGAIQLNCHVNTHGVKIKAPPHSAGATYTLVLPNNTGTNGQVLSTNGSGVLSFIDATETKPTVANVSQTIAPATATTINITGTNFVSIPQVDFINGSTGAVTRANTVSFTNATTLSVNVTLAGGNYFVRVENPDGNAGRSTNNIITASTAPSFTTNAGSLGTFAGNFSGTLFTIQGSSDSAVSFSEVTSVLSGANVTLSSAGVLATTDFGGSSTSPTTYNFTIRITDAEGQTADRAFSLTSSFGASGGGQFN